MQKKTLLILILLFFVILISVGMNPYLIPGYYDNALYFSLGRSLYQGGSYQFMGEYIVDWPPAYSTVLALVFSLFGPSILTAKITTACFALFALIWVYALLKKEERPYPLLILFIMSILPVGLAMGVRIGPEWMFIALSFAFLYIVETLKTRRTISLGLIAGVLLGAASLTRYIGVLLGVALIAQCWLIYRREGKEGFLKKITPEVVAAISGATIFLGWIAWIYSLALGSATDLQTGNYEKLGLSIFSHFSLNEIVLSLSDLLFQGINIGQTYEWSRFIILAVSYLTFFFIAIGFVRQIRSQHVKASDFYVLVTFVVLTCFQWKLSRYLLPIFPFLFSYLIQGGQLLFTEKKYGILFVFWSVLLLTIDAHLLFKGNNAEFNGLSPLVSRTGGEFYRDEWKEIYEESVQIPKAVEGKGCRVGIDPSLSKYVKYIHAWVGCEVSVQENEDVDYYIGGR